MITIVIKGSVLIKGLPLLTINKMQNELRLENQKYKDAIKYGKWIGKDLKEFLYFFKRRGSSIIVPRGYMSRVMRLVEGKEYEIKDFTVAPHINIEFTGKLRDYQQEAFDEVLKNRYGMLEAATGAGKTVIGTALAAERGVRTLVLVHNKELQAQWVEAFKTFTSIDNIGLIGGGGKPNIQDVTIGIINSASKIAGELLGQFGLVIYDECHRAIAPMWLNLINTVRPKYHIGLSATPFRNDGLTKALGRVVGPVLYKVSRKRIESIGAILIPRIIRIHTRFDCSADYEYSRVLSLATKDHLRNRLIANAIIDDFNLHDEPIMVVSDRVDHCLEIEELLQSIPGIQPVVLSGKMHPKDRKAGINLLKNGECNVLIATVQLLGEGFDSPELNAIFLTTPIKFTGRLLQIIGRVLRPTKNGGQPRVYDVRDPLIKMFKHSGFSRDKSYRKYGWY